MSNDFWIKASERMPKRDGEYLVVIDCGTDSYVELCTFDSKKKYFSSWDYYNDNLFIYKPNTVMYWAEIPTYENLEK